MSEPTHTIVESLRDYWGVFSAFLLFGLGIIWWYVRRLITRQDEVRTEQHSAVSTMLSQHNERLATIEREAIRRPELDALTREIRQDIKDGFRAVNDRLDRYWENKPK